MEDLTSDKYCPNCGSEVVVSEGYPLCLNSDCSKDVVNPVEDRPEEDQFECPYCGEMFESEHKRGVHISEEHVGDENIPRKRRNEYSKKDITDGWKARN